MIATEQELEIVSGQLQQLTGQRDSILRGSTDTHFRSHVELAGIEKMIARLQEEIAEYEQMKAATSEPLSRSAT